MNPSPGTATVADVVRIERKEKRLFELVDGVLVEKVMGFTESQLAIVIAAALSNYLEADDLGVVTGPDGMIRFPANLIRMPDVAFVPWEEFPSGEVTTEAAPEVVPGAGRGSSQSRQHHRRNVSQTSRVLFGRRLHCLVR